MCCNTRFALRSENSAGCRRGFRVKMWGPHRLTLNSWVTSVMRVRLYESAIVWSCNLQLLQQIPPQSGQWRIFRLVPDSGIRPALRLGGDLITGQPTPFSVNGCLHSVGTTAVDRCVSVLVLSRATP